MTLRDDRLAADPFSVGIADRPSNNLLTMDGPRHRLLRDLVMPYLGHNAIARLQPRLAEIRDGCVRRLLAGDDADLMRELIDPLVIRAALDAVGVDERDRPSIEDLLRSTLGALEPPDSTPAASSRDVSILRLSALLDRRARREETAGLQHDLRQAWLDGHIRQDQAVFTLPIVLHGGFENPRNALAAIIATAASDPEAFRHWTRRSPDAFISETLRLTSPVRGLVRWATRDVDALDAHRNDAVWVAIEDANRDPTSSKSPNEPDYMHPSRNLTFGDGAHRCPGTGLMRLLAREVTAALLELPPEVVSEVSVDIEPGRVARAAQSVAVRMRRT